MPCSNKFIVGAGHAREQIAVGHDRRHGSFLQKNRPGHQALRKGRASLSNHAYLITATTLNRQCFFDEFNASCAAARCFENDKVLGDARMLAWVLMPDHAHWLVGLGMQDNLSIVANRLKSSSSRLANRALDRRGTLWEPAYHDHALRAEEDLLNIARYIITNPLRAGLVQRIGDYPFWNAIWV
jgi:REP element-mobilizing transposase RayT